MSLDQKFENVPVTQLMLWWNGEELPEWSKETGLFLHKTASALVRAGEGGIAFLRSQVESEDFRKRYYALDKLAHPERADESIVQCLVKAFRSPPSDTPEVLAGFKILALEGLVRIGSYPLERREVEALLENSDKWLAAEAMAYLSHAFEAEAVAILSAGLESNNPAVRGRACTEAGFRNIRPLKERVTSLLNDADEYVARAAQIGCEVFEVAEE